MKKFRIKLDAEIEFSAVADTKVDAVVAFFEELSYIKTGELIKVDYDIEEVQ